MANRLSQIVNRTLPAGRQVSKKRIIFLVGPTAVGKTQVAIRLAKKLNAEIIGCDSMQAYKGMDVLTSMPSPALRKKIPHHLIRFQSPEKEYDVSRYRSQALKKIREIIKKKKTPLFTGGTGHYMSILVDGLFQARAQDKRIRARLYKEAQDKGSLFLYARLKKVDPLAAGKIHPHDTKRIIRALEVFEVTGRPISELQQQRTGLWDKYDIRIFSLNIQRDKLYERIDRRVEKMFSRGAVSEAKRLLKKKLSRTASYAIGLRELKGYFDGLYNLDEAKRLMQRNTRRLAKRQLTWFRKDKRIQWIEVADNEKPREIARRIWSALY
jgi:tRNA dimethylallyltransferase